MRIPQKPRQLLNEVCCLYMVKVHLPVACDYWCTHIHPIYKSKLQQLLSRYRPVCRLYYQCPADRPFFSSGPDGSVLSGTVLIQDA